jgi:hypothetical protein
MFGGFHRKRCRGGQSYSGRCSRIMRRIADARVTAADAHVRAADAAVDAVPTLTLALLQDEPRTPPTRR